MLGASLAFLTPHNRSNETPRSTTLLVGGGQEAGREKKRKEKKEKKGIPKKYKKEFFCFAVYTEGQASAQETCRSF